MTTMTLRQKKQHLHKTAAEQKKEKCYYKWFSFIGKYTSVINYKVQKWADKTLLPQTEETQGSISFFIYFLHRGNKSSKCQVRTGHKS